MKQHIAQVKQIYSWSYTITETGCSNYWSRCKKTNSDGYSLPAGHLKAVEIFFLQNIFFWALHCKKWILQIPNGPLNKPFFRTANRLIHGFHVTIRECPYYWYVLPGRAVNRYPGTRVPWGNSTSWVIKMLPGYPFKALNNSISVFGPFHCSLFCLSRILHIFYKQVPG